MLYYLNSSATRNDVVSNGLIRSFNIQPERCREQGQLISNLQPHVICRNRRQHRRRGRTGHPLVLTGPSSVGFGWPLARVRKLHSWSLCLRRFRGY